MVSTKTRTAELFILMLQLQQTLHDLKKLLGECPETLCQTLSSAECCHFGSVRFDDDFASKFKVFATFNGEENEELEDICATAQYNAYHLACHLGTIAPGLIDIFLDNDPRLNSPDIEETAKDGIINEILSQRTGHNLQPSQDRYICLHSTPALIALNHTFDEPSRFSTLKYLLQKAPKACGVKDDHGRPLMHLALDISWNEGAKLILETCGEHAAKAKDSEGQLILHKALQVHSEFSPLLSLIMPIIRANPGGMLEKDKHGSYPLDDMFEIREETPIPFDDSISIIEAIKANPECLKQKSDLYSSKENLPIHRILMTPWSVANDIEIVRVMIEEYPESLAIMNDDGLLPLHCIAKSICVEDWFGVPIDAMSLFDVFKLVFNKGYERRILDDEFGCIFKKAELCSTPLQSVLEKFPDAANHESNPFEAIIGKPCILHGLFESVWDDDELKRFITNFRPNISDVDSNGNTIIMKAIDLITSGRTSCPYPGELMKVLVAQEPNEDNEHPLKIPNSVGQLPIHYATQKGLRWDQGLGSIVEGHISAISVEDPVSGLYPVMLACVSEYTNVASIFELMRRKADLLKYHEGTPDSASMEISESDTATRTSTESRDVENRAMSASRVAANTVLRLRSDDGSQESKRQRRN